MGAGAGLTGFYPSMACLGDQNDQMIGMHAYVCMHVLSKLLTVMHT